MTTYKPIRTDQDHEDALREIAGLMGAEPGSAEADRLEVLAVLVAEYERAAFEDPPEPADVLETAMQMQGRTQAELSAVLGSRARASEVLGRTRGLSGEQAERVAGAWGLPLRLLGGAGGKRKAGARAALGVLACVAVIAIGAAAGTFIAAARGLPDVAPVVGLATAAGGVDVATLPPHVYQAVLAAQDGRFFVHRGYDPRGIAGAAGWNLSPSHWAHPSGGSTLTQQLAKGVLLRSEPKGLRRKIRELLMAREIERRLSKEQILNAWLNSVPFGGGVHGLADASRAYFATVPQNLTVGEAAYLAAVPNAPERLRLDRTANHDSARTSRDRIVGRMVGDGYLTPALARAVADEALTPAL